MATNPPPCSHISFEFFHRCTTDPPPVLFPCPRNYSAPHLYRTALEDMATDLCRRRLNLLPCCVSSLVPEIVAKIAAVAADHRCSDVQSVELHVFPYVPNADEILRELLEADEILMESFDAAQPKPTPASLASIEKLVAQEGDDSSSSCSSIDDEFAIGSSVFHVPN